MLAVDNPSLLPDIGRGLFKQAGLFQSGAHFGGEDLRQGFDRNQKLRILGLNPVGAIKREASGSDKHVDVRVVEHGAGPGVQHREHPQTCAKKSRICSQLLQGIGGGFHEQAVDDFGVLLSQWA